MAWRRWMLWCLNVRTYKYISRQTIIGWCPINHDEASSIFTYIGETCKQFKMLNTVWIKLPDTKELGDLKVVVLLRWTWETWILDINSYFEKKVVWKRYTLEKIKDMACVFMHFMVHTYPCLCTSWFIPTQDKTLRLLCYLWLVGCYVSL